jgi:hypothetical protein
MNATTSAVETDWSFSVQVFLYLQVLDVITTLLGLRMGAGEASPFIRMLMTFGPVTGLLGAKLVGFALGAYCVATRRFRTIQIVNYFFAALILWNLANIMAL